MPHHGAAPGERRGGRAKGTPNKRTLRRIAEQNIIEQAQAAELAATKLANSRKKLAVDVLEEFTLLFAGMAAVYQPLPPGADPENVPPGREPDPMKFERWARLACDTADKLAPYQSPTFRAIVVAPAPEQPSGERTQKFSLRVFDGGPAPGPPRLAEVTRVEPPADEGEV